MSPNPKKIEDPKPKDQPDEEKLPPKSDDPENPQIVDPGPV